MIASRKECLTKAMLAGAFSCVFHFSYAQNLVPNGSFSDFDSTGFHFWQHLTDESVYTYDSGKGKNTAAYLVAEVQGKFPNSSTYYGYGSGEKGMLVKLKEPLLADTYYHLSAKVKQADSSVLILNNLGVYFSKKPSPDALLSLSGVNATGDWHYLQDVYLAKGGEQYLYIGNMSNTGIETSWNNKFERKKYKTEWEQRQDAYKHLACYLVDDVVLQKVAAKPVFTLNKKLVPKDVLFETAKTALSGEAESYLLLLASYLRSNPKVLVSIEGFADERGTGEYNQALSKNRAISVANYLLQHGIAKERIQLRWYGSEKAGNKESEYHLDRKIQLELVSN